MTAPDRCAARRCGSRAGHRRRRSALTDAEGRFEFRELPGRPLHAAGVEVRLRDVQYGQTRPFESGRPIELADKQVLDKADIAMPRGGVISGRIVDEFGDPVADVQVTAMRQTWSNGRRRLTPTPGRIASDQRSRTVPHLRPAARRVLRQRDAARSAVEMMDMESMMVGDRRSRSQPRRPRPPRRRRRATRRPTSRAPRTSPKRSASRSRSARKPRAPTSRSSPVRLARDHRHRHQLRGQAGRRRDGVGGAGQRATSASRSASATARSARNGNFTLNSVAAGRLHAAGARGAGHHLDAGRQHDDVPRRDRRRTAATRSPARLPLGVGGEDLVERRARRRARARTAVGRVVVRRQREAGRR